MVIELSMDIMRPVRSESMVSYGCHQPVLAAERSVNFNAVLMIRVENCLHNRFFRCKFIDFPIDNV